MVAELRTRRSPRDVAGQRRFGIQPTTEQLGLSVVFLRRMARPYRRRHDVALALWEHPIHEARLLACFIADPKGTTAAQMEIWVRDFDSWDLCDQACLNVFCHTPHAVGKARAWSKRRAEYVKRAGFVLMATLAVHAKAEPDDTFRAFLAIIAREAEDERNFVRKAMSWALRQIGKRNAELRRAAIVVAQELAARESRTARWVARNALRELGSRREQAPD
jgi:3-methyladenine DNA glycosylase AlkD